MADLRGIFGEGFDPAAHEPAKDFPVLPPGDYPCEVEKIELKQTRAGTGYYLAVQLVVLGGEFGNQKLWHNINIANQSTQAEAIGRREFSALCQAARAGKVEDTDELLQKQVVARVKVKEGQNVVRTYSAPKGAQQQPAQQQPAQEAPAQQPAQQQPAQSAAGQPYVAPWDRPKSAA